MRDRLLPFKSEGTEAETSPCWNRISNEQREVATRLLAELMARLLRSDNLDAVSHVAQEESNESHT